MQVLQKQLDLELELCGDSKEPKSHHNVVARVSVLGLNSQPVDHEDTAKLNPHDVSGKGLQSLFSRNNFFPL